MTGIDVAIGAGNTELAGFQEHFHEYQIVYQGLSCDEV
jgi:hypothetical protein